MEETSNTGADTQSLVHGLAEEACVSLFEAYGVNLERKPLEAMPGGEHSLTGIIGFTGTGITGMCLIAATEEPLRATNPTDGPLRDWMAELSNQLAGRLKHKLLTQGAEVYITTPIVLRATRIEPLPRTPALPSGFSASKGSLALWVEVDTSPEFVLAPSGEVPVAEGETLLF
ncbi:MAG TPA: chemotaxis protein CheX [Polyangiales bacterium]